VLPLSLGCASSPWFSRTRNLTDCFSGKPPQAIAHIRCLFSVLADPAGLSSFETSPDSIIFIAAEFAS
jgi:hypothetical protein